MAGTAEGVLLRVDTLEPGCLDAANGKASACRHCWLHCVCVCEAAGAVALCASLIPSFDLQQPSPQTYSRPLTHQVALPCLVLPAIHLDHTPTHHCHYHSTAPAGCHPGCQQRHR
jgi:hypothetical protein